MFHVIGTSFHYLSPYRSLMRRFLRKRNLLCIASLWPWLIVPESRSSFFIIAGVRYGNIRRRILKEGEFAERRKDTNNNRRHNNYYMACKPFALYLGLVLPDDWSKKWDSVAIAGVLYGRKLNTVAICSRETIKKINAIQSNFGRCGKNRINPEFFMLQNILLQISENYV